MRTAVETQTLGFDDESQLLYATCTNRVILSHNQRHFQQLHTRFLASNRPHGGIVLIPNGSLALVHRRAAMLVAWFESPGSVTSRLAGFTEAEVRQALAIDPIDA